MLTEREVTLRVMETLAGSGMREPERLMRDVRKVRDEIMECDDGAPKRGRPAKDASKED